VWAVCPVCWAGRRFGVCQWRFGLGGNPVLVAWMAGGLVSLLSSVYYHCLLTVLR